MHFFRGLRLAGAAEMQPAGETSKVFSKKVGLFLASDTSDRFEDIMHDIIYSTKKSDFFDFLLGLSEKACVTGMRGQSFSHKNRKSQPLRPDFFEKDGEEAMIFSKNQKIFRASGLFCSRHSICVYGWAKKIAALAGKSAKIRFSHLLK